VLDRLLATGRVELFASCDYDGSAVVSRLSGERFEVPDRCRVVDASYLAPGIPAESPPPFAVVPGATVLPVNDLVHLDHAPRQYVVAGAGKTATDAIVWLLGRGVDPDAICWVRPRDPWMLNRAVVQPDPAIFLGMAADVMEAATAASSLDDLFLRLEDAGVMLRIDRAVTPTMAKAPTLAAWELDLLRSVEHVLRRGRLTAVEDGRLHFADGTVPVRPGAVVVHCAADGLKQPPLVPVWRPEVITVQPIRAGFPCFGAALVGYLEATRRDDPGDAEKNRLAPPSPYGNTLADWARSQLLGARAARSFGTAADVRSWADGVALNPSRIPPGHPASPTLDRARERLAAATPTGLERLAALT
jgi:hypothetical protein